MEAKLKSLANQLPEPGLKFRNVEKQVKIKRRSGIRLRPLIAALLVICLVSTVFAYGVQRYGLWSAGSSTSFADVKLLNRKYDYQFPETLGGSSFERVSTTYGATQGASHLQALLQPTYRLHTIIYQGKDGSSLTVSFGSTARETWKYHFSVAEDGSSTAQDLIPSSQSFSEYEGYTLHRYKTGNTDNVRWEDTQRQLVIDITIWNQEMDVLAIAKELIDLNR